MRSQGVGDEPYREGDVGGILTQLLLPGWKVDDLLGIPHEGRQAASDVYINDGRLSSPWRSEIRDGVWRAWYTRYQDLPEALREALQRVHGSVKGEYALECLEVVPRYKAVDEEKLEMVEVLLIATLRNSLFRSWVTIEKVL